MGVAVSKISMLTHCQALTQACNYCEGQDSALYPKLTSSLYETDDEERWTCHT